MIPGFFKKVTIVCSDVFLQNRAESHKKAITRLSWGIGLLLGGTVLSGALKQFGGQIIGNWVAAAGACVAVHAVAVAQIVEHWKWAGLTALVVGCLCAVILLRNKGVSMEKLFERMKRKPN